MKVTKGMAYGLMAAAAVLWATSGTLTTLAIDEGATANQVAVYAAVFSVVVLLPAIHILDRPSLRLRRKDFPAMLLFAVLTGSIFSLAWYHCVDLTSVTTAVILLYSYPSIVTLASVFLLKEKLTVAKAIALPLTFIGCLLVSGAYDLELVRLNLVGIGLGVYTGVAAAIYYLWTKKWLVTYSANTVALYLAILTVPGVVLLAEPLTLLDTPLTTDAWLLIFLIGLLPGTVGFVISMVALKHIEASKASIVASIEPVAGVMLAVLVISEALEWLQVAGVVLVVAGVLMLRIAHRDGDDIPETPPGRTAEPERREETANGK